MPLFAIPYPVIDPVLLQIGPFAIRWYALAYIVALVVGWRYCLRLARQKPIVATPAQVDDFLVWATLGVVLGGRLGYVLLYKADYYFANPLEALEVWHGGMSFHGGAIGVLVAIGLFCWQRNINFLAFADIICCAVPIGLFFGRLANFINGELWGRVSDVPWAMVFPTGGPEPRHPSQLYEAGLEGILLFVVINGLAHVTTIRQVPGRITGVFLVGYGCARIVSEMFRQPDAFLGFLALGLTMGQWLSLPFIIVGLILLLRPQRRLAAA